MNNRNKKWYDLVKDVKELVKNSEHVEIENNYCVVWEGENGISYQLSDKFTGYSVSGIRLNEYSFDDGCKYVLHCNRKNNKSGFSESGTLIVVKDRDSITFKREGAFLTNEQDKPFKSEEVLSFVKKAIKQANSHIKLDELLTDKNKYKQRKKAHIYMKYKDIQITGDETEEELNSIVENSKNIKELDTYDFIDDVLKEHFNCKDKEHLETLKYNIKNREYFLSNCISKGILGKDYYYCEQHFYKMNLDV